MKKVITVLFVFSTFNVAGQHVVIPASHNPFNIDYQKHAGYILLNNGEKITGIFQYDFWEFPNYNLKLFSENGKGLKRYKIINIESVVLAGSDTTLTNKDSTYFKVLGKHKGFYRQLTFGSLEVYDNFFDVNEKKNLIKPLLFVRFNNQLHEFNSSEKFIKWMKANYPNKIEWDKNITLEGIVRQLNGKPPFYNKQTNS